MKAAASSCRLHQAVDAVARKAEDGVDAPIDQPVEEQIARRCRHGDSPSISLVEARVIAG